MTAVHCQRINPNFPLLVQGEVRNVSVIEKGAVPSFSNLPKPPSVFVRLRDKTGLRQKSVLAVQVNPDSEARKVDCGLVVWKSYLITHAPLGGPTGLTSISSPGPSCLLVSAKSRSSGIINFRNSKILGISVSPKSEIRRSLELKRLQQQHEIFVFTSLVGDFCVIFVNYKLFYTR